MSTFKQQHTFSERQAESTRVLEKYSSRIPVIMDTYKSQVDLDKTKYLIPSNMTASEFIFTIRRRTHTSEEEALYMFVGNTLVTSHKTMSEIYNQFKDDDGFLYCTVAKEATFG